MSSASTPSLRIQERFVSVQGEGSLVGTSSQFIRVSGCNLRCAWCDSPKSSWAPEGETMAVESLIRDCASGPRHVVLTGGEPMLFAASVGLIDGLRAKGHHVTVESAGTKMLEGFSCDLISLSPKLANSTPRERAPALAERHESQRWNPPVLQALSQAARDTQLKFVVRAYDAAKLEVDVAEVRACIASLAWVRAEQVFLMPECTQPERLHQDYLRVLPHCEAHGFRLGERLHIALFGDSPGT